jgi:CDP-paratose synthetase
MIKKTILITGATGYLGSKVLSNLLAENFNLIILKRSTSNISRIQDVIQHCKFYDINIKSISSIFDENNIDIVLHLATNYGRNEDPIMEIINSNFIFPITILESVLKNNVRHFINIDSVLEPKTNIYSLSKSHFRNFLELYSTKIDIINIELEYFYGPDDANWKFINMIFNKFSNNEKEINLTSGEQHRNFIFIDDVVDAIIIILNNLNLNSNGFNSIGIGTDNSISIKDLVYNCKLISQNKNTILNFGRIKNREKEIRILKCDNSHIKKLGWNAKIDLDTGLNYVWRSLKKNNI